MDLKTKPEVFEQRVRQHNSRHLPYIFIGDFTAEQSPTSEYIEDSRWALEDDEREIRERFEELERRDGR